MIDATENGWKSLASAINALATCDPETLHIAYMCATALQSVPGSRLESPAAGVFVVLRPDGTVSEPIPALDMIAAAMTAAGSAASSAAKH